MKPGEQLFSNQSWETRWGSMSEGDCVWVPGLSGYFMLASSVQEREVIDVIDVSHPTNKCFAKSMLPKLPSTPAGRPVAQRPRSAGNKQISSIGRS